MISAAALISVASLLIMGAFDYVWYNYRIFYMFWIALAIGVACIKIGERELLRTTAVFDSDEFSAAIDVDIQ